MKRVYLDNAATSIPDAYVLDAAAAFADLLRTNAGSTKDLTIALGQIPVQARSRVASFLNCDADEIALVQSTSHALGTLACCLPLEQGDNVLICDLEYQASVACWHPRAEQVGFELRQVTTHNGRITAEDFKRYIDDRTKVILLAAVQEINGFRADVKEIGELAHEYGCYYIVDGIQEAGALQVDVKELGLDFYCAGGKKWLGNPFGAGFLYIRKEVLDTLRPPYYSYFDIQVMPQYRDYLTYLEDPRRHPFDPFTPSKKAAVFETGGYGNYIGALGLDRAIQVLDREGMDRVEKKILDLSTYLDNGLRTLGMCVSSSEELKHRSSIVSFSFCGLKNDDVTRERELIRFLQERDIFVSLRCSTGVGGIRVSVHHYTPREYVDIFLNALEDFNRSTSK